MSNKFLSVNKSVLEKFLRLIASKKLKVPFVFFMLSFHLLAQQPASRLSDKTTLLFNAIRSGSTEELQQQLSNGADVNDSLNSYSALMAATLNGSLEQMKLLIDHGANVNYQSGDGTTALWLAVPDWDKTKLLLDHGADPNHKIHGYGVLVKLAAIPGTINLFHLLIDKGADLKKMASDNWLMYNAAGSGDTSILGFIIRSGFNVNDSTAFGDYPVNSAVFFRGFSTLKMLIDDGANVNAKSSLTFAMGLDALKGCTPLMFAAVSHDKPSFFYLLEHGADPNAKNKQGYTPLMLLEQSETDDPEMTLALIKYGAHVSEQAPDKTNALYYASQKGNTESVEILKKHSKK
jgi:ankyrin repeat protein